MRPSLSIPVDRHRPILQAPSAFLLVAGLAGLLLLAPVAGAQCPEKPLLGNFGGAGSVVCPCFVTGEEAGAVFTVPPEHLPIEVIRVGIAWGSQFGGAPTTLETAIHFYEGGLPDPGTPVSSLFGPQMSDGFINEFDLVAQGAVATITTSTFTTTLEFGNDNAGNIFAPSMVHDGVGCQSGKNVVFAVPGGWSDSCLLGVTGDWVVYAAYREVECGLGVAEEHLVVSGPLVLLPPRPNPFADAAQLEFQLERAGRVTLDIYDLAGRRIVGLLDREFPAGRHGATWDGRLAGGAVAPSGVYFGVLQSGDLRSTQKIVRSR